MKFLLSIFILTLSGISLYAQKKSKDVELKSCAGFTITYQFEVGDSLIKCSNCRRDQCGNIINNNLDTIYKNQGLVHPDFHPIYITSDSILLTKGQVGKLKEENKIVHMQFLHCNEVSRSMGFLALEGLYLITLRDTTINTIPLINVVRKKYGRDSINNSQILINGYHIKSDNILYSLNQDVEITHLVKGDLYCILTE